MLAGEASQRLAAFAAVLMLVQSAAPPPPGGPLGVHAFGQKSRIWPCGTDIVLTTVLLAFWGATIVLHSMTPHCIVLTPSVNMSQSPIWYMNALPATHVTAAAEFITWTLAAVLMLG